MKTTDLEGRLPSTPLRLTVRLSPNNREKQSILIKGKDSFVVPPTNDRITNRYVIARNEAISFLRSRLTSLSPSGLLRYARNDGLSRPFLSSYIICPSE